MTTDHWRLAAERETRWRELLDAERDARQLIDDAARSEVPPSTELVRAWWSALAALMTDYANALDRREVPTPPPSEALRIVAKQAGYLAVGTIPAPIEGVAAGGRSAPGPDEARDIGLAVAYRRACSSDGLQHGTSVIHISDPAPMKTLAGWYGVAPRTLQKWVKADYQLVGIRGRLTADVLISLTKQAGARYLNAGRSHAATAIRARGDSK